MINKPFTSAAYFAAKSSLKLEEVCQALQAEYNLSPFVLEAEDDFQYGWAATSGIKFNVTMTQDYQLIHSWMSQAPKNVNYQIIFEFDSSDHNEEDKTIEEIRLSLKRIFDNDVSHYHTL